MIPLRSAIYARVSSEQKASAQTIASQVAMLDTRLGQDGVRLSPDCRFLDEGYSGATLLRPALERLRDAAAAGEIDGSMCIHRIVWRGAMPIRCC